MATAVIMPKAGVAMEEGTVIQWHKAIGDQVQEGEPLLEIETDKVSMEIEAESSGYLISILRHAGETVPVVETIGYIGKKDEKTPAASTAPNQGSPKKDSDSASKDSAISEPPIETSPVSIATPERVLPPRRTIAATPAARRIAAEHDIDLRQAQPSGSQGELRAADIGRLINASADSPQSPRVSSLARKIAHTHAVDLAKVQGGGISGRIERQDVEQYLAQRQQHRPTGGRRVVPTLPATPQRLTGIRKIIAQRMYAVHQEVPPVTLVRPAPFDALRQLRKELNELQEDHLSVNSLLSYATVQALQEYPELNATFRNNELRYHQQINLGIAVAVTEGLLVPVVKSAEKRDLVNFSQEVTALAERARNNHLLPDELQEGTFTVTNLGMYGITEFTPIINAPQLAILGICAPETVIQLQNGHPVEQTRLSLALTIDHRVLDGAIAAQFLQRLAEIIAHPIQLLL